ncbi:lymphocyte antigen 96 isoform X1 [Sus scrofa]|uniref:Lymphocyte antigen 96 n=4 Tax=Artiodactyla TaxID=91561 RepID=LY96_BOVIN|nr:lymphocyte antigen 96 [Sus scrofa]XP_020944097.1 lymphocyte antigen 96 isoform X1 [Sus scrofa]P58754.1 RecName: Full=Lymphocyte antigen 96; Short=Ly-96; AltName: Full=Protein MD-2; Flags: Precursor [Bos taurus]AAL16721.1 MD-2 protein [Bos taurus]BAF74787.1 lymphocyte antigen 96 [Sus scrofa]
MFPFMLFSTLFSSIFTEPREKMWICNSSDASLWYNYCDDMKFPISVKVEPCVTIKGTKGKLHLYYIARRDIQKLYLNLHISIKSMTLPMRKEVICREYGGDYSFCGALKGETVNTTIPFSFQGIRFSPGQYHCVVEAISGNSEEMLFCLNFTIIHYSSLN